jgi:hypothetical protein
MSILEPSSSNPPAAVPVWKRLAVLVPLLLFTTLTYTFLHEGGHALIGLLQGGKLTAFDVNFFNLSAHVGITGNFSTGQNALRAAAGIGLPLLVWLVWILVLPKITNPLLEWFKVIASIAVINSLLAWLVIPFLFLAGQTPSDDSTYFLSITGIPPLLVAGVVVLIYLGGWTLLIFKVGGARGLADRLRADVSDWKQPALARTWRGMTAAALAMLVVVVGLNMAVGPSDVLRAPAGYTRVAELDLSGQAYKQALVYQFELREPTRMGIFIAMQNIQTGPFKIEMTGPDGYTFTFVQFTDPKVGIGKASSHPTDLPMEKGLYQILLTVPKNPGKIIIYTGQ